MTVQLASMSYTSRDAATTIPSYLASPNGDGPHPAVLILRGVAGPDDGYTEISRRLAEWGYVALLHGWKVPGADPPDAPVYERSDGSADLPPISLPGRSEEVVGIPIAALFKPRTTAGVKSSPQLPHR